jgi:hypothetical protein
MITANMNNLEINRHLWEVFTQYPLVLATMQKFRKECRKLPRGRVVMSRKFFHKEHNQTYILCLSQDKGFAGTLLLAEVDHGKQKWYYVISEDLTDSTDAYSAHFFKRYAERTGKPFVIPNIITQFFKDNRDVVKIYESIDKKECVYASRNGILLGRNDIERGITKHCTYVDRDMLQPTQEEALQAILCDIDTIEEMRKDNVPFYKMKDKDCAKQYEQNRSWANSTAEASGIACAIYKQYFEEDDEKSEI